MTAKKKTKQKPKASTTKKPTVKSSGSKTTKKKSYYKKVKPMTEEKIEQIEVKEAVVEIKQPEAEDKALRFSLKSIGDKIITNIITENPKRKNSPAAKRFDLYKDGQTVAELIQAGGLMSDLREDVKNKYVEVK